MNHPGEDELVLFIYGEAGDGQKPTAEHLEACAGCRANVANMRRILAAVDSHAVPERGPGYEAEVWARVRPNLERAPARAWLWWLTPRRLGLAAGAAMLVVTAFIAGRYTAPSAPPVGPDASKTRATAPAVNEAAIPRPGDDVLMVAVEDHLQRSENMLVELMNGSSAAGPDVDISAERDRARELVPANRLIRQTAGDTGEVVVEQVLGDLERLLVEIANSPSKVSSAELKQVQQRIDAQDLVFKIRVLDTQVRRAAQSLPARGGRASS